MARVYGICYTLHDYTPAQTLSIQACLGKMGIGYVCFGREVCPTSGRPHLQGYLQMVTKPKYDRMKTMFGVPVAGQSLKFTVANGSDVENYNYCSKDGDFWEAGNRQSIAGAKKGQRTDVDAVKKAIDDGKSYDNICDENFETASRMHRFIKERVQARDTIKQLDTLRERYASSALRPWQQALLDVVSETACPRKIHWLWETTGNVGKSWMATYLGAVHGATILTTGKKVDLAYIYAQKPTTIVLFDLSRTNETASESERKHYLDGIYSLAEDLKNGRVVSTKYESKTVFFDPPHVVFFANFEPDYTKWSADRYNVIGL